MEENLLNDTENKSFKSESSQSMKLFHNRQQYEFLVHNGTQK